MAAEPVALAVQPGRRALLNLSAGHIAELVAELRPLLEGATLTEIAGLPPRDVMLVLRDLPGTATTPSPARLRVSADSDAPRLYLQTSRQDKHHGPLGPFFRRLQADLTGATLRRIEQVARDRIVRLEFAATPCGESRTLLAELTGRHANLLLLGPSERVLEVLVQPAPHKDRAPRLVVGEPWHAPPGAPRPASESPGLREALGDAPDLPARAPLSFLVQERLGREVAELAQQRAQRDLNERIERKLKRARSLAVGLQQRLAASEDAERVRLDGEALKQCLPLVRRGQSSVRVPDPFGPEGSEREIHIDPRRRPQENVEAIFERYKKLVRARATVEAELALAEERVRELELLRARVGGASEVEALEREAVERGLIEPPQEPDQRKRKQPEPRKPYRQFVGSRGSEIRVGRSAKDNDELTQRHCRGNDVWLHTADAPGSHVVLPLAKNAEPDPEEVLDAAHLAVHFSPLRGAHRAVVHVARGKEVHKPRGAKPGLVVLSGGKSLAVRMQPERLQRLLASART